MDRNQLIGQINTLLDIDRYKDYAPNGLQVEGRDEVHTVVTAVTASQAVIEQAVELGADLLLVHHGYFWKGEDPRVIGPKRRRLQQLLSNEINLAAYHLPLDGHPELGNNAQWGRQLGCRIEGTLERAELVCYGTLDEPVTARAFAESISSVLGGRVPMVIEGHGRPIRRVGWCSGGAQGYIEQAAEAGLDAYLSGEISERTYHEARERGISYFACGHHATEKGGVLALGGWIEEQFGLPCRFVDEDNPV